MKIPVTDQFYKFVSGFLAIILLTLLVVAAVQVAGNSTNVAGPAARTATTSQR